MICLVASALLLFASHPLLPDLSFGLLLIQISIPFSCISWGHSAAHSLSSFSYSVLKANQDGSWVDSYILNSGIQAFIIHSCILLTQCVTSFVSASVRCVVSPLPWDLRTLHAKIVSCIFSFHSGLFFVLLL